MHCSEKSDFRREKKNLNCILYWRCSIRKYISRPLQYIWNEEEVRLATGIEGATRLQHHLKLCSAYLGVPVSLHSSLQFSNSYLQSSNQLL